MNQKISTLQRFLFLDAFRGLAAVYVTIFHFCSILKEKATLVLPPFVDFLLLRGTICLQIFFVLSGFVIAYSIFRQEITWGFFGKFFIRRSVRLDPPYWAALFLTIMMSLFSVIFFTKPLSDLPTAEVIMANIFYLQDFFQVERINHVSWTLCLEIQLYLFFVALTGVLCWFQKNYNFRTTEKIFDSPVFTIPFGLLFLFSLAQNLDLAFMPHIPGLFIPYWYIFFTGSVLCWVHMQALSVRYYLICFSCLALFFLATTKVQIGETFIVSFLIFILSQKNKLYSLLAVKPCLYLGKISYSLYLTHWMIGGKFMDAMSRRYADRMDIGLGLILLVASLAIAFLTAHYFHLWVELPSLEWSRRLKLTFSRQRTL